MLIEPRVPDEYLRDKLAFAFGYRHSRGGLDSTRWDAYRFVRELKRRRDGRKLTWVDGYDHRVDVGDTVLIMTLFGSRLVTVKEIVADVDTHVSWWPGFPLPAVLIVESAQVGPAEAFDPIVYVATEGPYNPRKCIGRQTGGSDFAKWLRILNRRLAAGRNKRAA